MLLPGEFKFNNIESTTLANSKIQLRPEVLVPRRKTTLIPTPGVSGDYILDENAYDNTSMMLEMICQVLSSDGTVLAVRNRIASAFDSGGYVPLELYFDPDHIYYAKTIEGPTFRLSGEWPDILLYSVELTLKPFKETTQEVDATVASGNSIVLTNPSSYSSPLIITMTGMGAMTLTVNGDTFNFNDVDDYIIVDSVVEEAYKLVNDGVVGRNDKMFTRQFPYFKPGKNTVSFTGATKIDIEGRWRTLVS